MNLRLQHDVTGLSPAGSAPHEAPTEPVGLTHGKRQISDRWARPASDTQWGNFYTKVNGSLQLACPSASLGQELHDGQKLTSQCPKGMSKEKFWIWFRDIFLFDCPFKRKTSSVSFSPIQQTGKDYPNCTRNLKSNTSLCVRIVQDWDLFKTLYLQRPLFPLSSRVVEGYSCHTSVITKHAAPSSDTLKTIQTVCLKFLFPSISMLHFCILPVKDLELQMGSPVRGGCNWHWCYLPAF